jgi:type IV pilus assembly protein PilY1
MSYYQDEGEDCHKSYYYRDKKGNKLYINYGSSICEKGGKLLVGCSDDSNRDVLAWMDHYEDYPDNKELRADGATPIAGSLHSARDYTRDVLVPAGPSCRRNFVILMTDGIETCGGDPCAAAAALNPVKNVDGDDTVLYVIGFAMAEQKDKDTLECIAAKGGDGHHDIDGDDASDPYFAENAQELEYVLGQAIEDIARGVSSATAVAVLSTSGIGEDKLYRAKFLPNLWQGHLQCFRLDAAGELIGHPDSPEWEAADGPRPLDNLNDRSARSRTIYTTIDGNRTEFTAMNLKDILSATACWDVTPEEAADIIDYIRGDDRYEGKKYRNRRGWKLGDIVYSAPVVVGAPSSYRPEESYDEFRLKNEKRKSMVYVGANDGMLHGFDAESGYEEWAFIPGNLLPRLKDLISPNYCHEYFVDLTPKAADVETGTGWKTVLIVGERGGGNAYFCLDVTNPDNPSYLWKFTDGELGETWSIPAVGKVSDGRWAAIVGSAYENSDSKIYLFAIDIADGSPMVKMKVSEDTGNVLTSPTALDVDNDGDIDTVYVGDLKGKLWRLDANTWSISKLFDTMGQPITARPTVSLDSEGNVWVYFGTGKFYDMGDKDTTDQQTFYGIMDDGSGDTVDKSELANVTIIPESLEGRKGWYLNLQTGGPSERVIEEAAVVSEVVFFTTFKPNNDVCSYGGTSSLYALDYLTGGVAVSGDEGVLEGVGEVQRSKVLGPGMPSAPVISTRYEKAIIQTSDGTIHRESLKLPEMKVSVRSWREVVF